jgi:hypothetical protein
MVRQSFLGPWPPGRLDILNACLPDWWMLPDCSSLLLIFIAAYFFLGSVWHSKSANMPSLITQFQIPGSVRSALPPIMETWRPLVSLAGCLDAWMLT